MSPHLLYIGGADHHLRMPAMQAALAGLPIVTTSMPGCTDVVRDGWSGFLVPPREPKVLAPRNIELLDNQVTAAAMSARAEELVRREFGLDLTIDRCVAAYKELLDDPARHESPAVKVPPNPGSPLPKIFS